MPIIEVDHVTKEYRLGQLTSLKQSALNALNRLTGRPVEQRQPFKALDDVTFSVEQGEVLGIIGHNGAGKSTLLKLLANISKPTAGRIAVRGKVAPLIEVGAGLVADLTGRENIFLNGTILGIPKAEIRRRFDDIVAFAELEQFIDTPIKRYSSGMQVRLGFSIATSVESDILIVDEVLAVGDLAFQRKCFDRMEDLIKHQGRTVLLVSHNIRQVERLCKRVLLLTNGEIAEEGNPRSVCNRFFEESDKKIQSELRRSRQNGIVHSQTASDMDLLSITLFDAASKPVDFVLHAHDLVVKIKYRIRRPIERLTFAIGIHTPDLLYLASKDTGKLFKTTTIDSEIFEISCTIKNFPFLPGNYAIRTCVAQGDAVLFYAENLCPFVVISAHGSRADMSEEGFVPLSVTWTPPNQSLDQVTSSTQDLCT